MDSNPEYAHTQVSSETPKINSPQALLNEQLTQTPKSNTGVNPAALQFGLGWLTLTFTTPADTAPAAYARHITRLYESLTVDYFLKEAPGLNYYSKTLRYRSGSFLAFSDDRADLCLSVTQKCLDTLSPKRLAKLLYKLNTLENFKITRLDVYFDDYQRLLNTFVVEKALQSGLHPSKSKLRNVNRTWDGNKLLGDTIYMGSKHSEFYVRLYDKGLESEGKQDCMRLEFQMRAETAFTFFNKFIYSSYLEWGTRTMALLLDKFDFVDREGPRRDRTKRRLDWWHKLVASSASIHWRVERVKAKLLSTIAWAEDCLPTTFSMIASVFGVDGLASWAANLMLRGASRMKHKHNGMVDEYLASIRTPAFT